MATKSSSMSGGPPGGCSLVLGRQRSCHDDGSNMGFADRAASKEATVLQLARDFNGRVKPTFAECWKHILWALDVLIQVLPPSPFSSPLVCPASFYPRGGHADAGHVAGRAAEGDQQKAKKWDAQQKAERSPPPPPSPPCLCLRLLFPCIHL